MVAVSKEPKEVNDTEKRRMPRDHPGPSLGIQSLTETENGFMVHLNDPCVYVEVIGHPKSSAENMMKDA